MAASAPTRIKLNPSFWQHGFCVPFSEDILPSSLFLKHRHFLIVDIETQRSFQEVGGFENLDKLGISVACAYDSKTDQFLSFRENELKKLFDLCEDRLVVGYNIRGFDLPVMGAYGLDYKRLDVFDIMYDLETLTRQRFLKLEFVARGTLGTGKSADGLQAIEWWKAGQVEKIIEYCLQDVKVTRDIFQYGRQNGFVKIQRSDDNTSQVPVQWS
ncbi:MAG: ribonuclease H-like domain-containing protein [Bacteriovoracia bacterium]